MQSELVLLGKALNILDVVNLEDSAVAEIVGAFKTNDSWLRKVHVVGRNGLL